MNIVRFLDRQAEALEHVLGYRTAAEPSHREAVETVRDSYTIALSREAGTPALEVAQEVGARLGWAVYDREIPALIAQQLQIPLAAVEDCDERRQSWLLDCLESFGSCRHLSEGRYFRHLVAVIRSLGEQGRCLIVGRGATFILPPRSTLRVLLVGERENRIAAFGRRFHVDRGTAAHKLHEVSRERSRFLREHFHIDPGQPRNYDLVVNTSQWSPAECADFIVRALHHKATEHPLS